MIFSYYIGKGMFWFRINGRGLSIKNIREHKLLFSERIGEIKILKIGRWVLRFI